MRRIEVTECVGPVEGGSGHYRCALRHPYPLRVRSLDVKVDGRGTWASESIPIGPQANPGEFQSGTLLMGTGLELAP
jgi:hypothetical protein